MNKFIAIGNLVRDPDLGETANGRTYARFTLAVARPYQKDVTDFFNCTAWGATAELVGKYCQKGNKLAITGVVQLRQYEDNQGIKKVAVDIMVDSVEFLTSKQEQQPKKATVTRAPNLDEEAPF